MKKVTRAIELARTPTVPKRKTSRRSERILVAVNLTKEGGELVTWALTLGSRSGDTVTVIHVVEPCTSLATRAQVSMWDRQKKDMLNGLSELVTHCRTKYPVPPLAIVVQVVESEVIGDAIVQEARNLEATRVILGKQKSRRLDISSKRITELGRLCVQSLEPHCEILIVRNGKLLVRRPGRAKIRQSLETFLLSNKTQESEGIKEADKAEQNLLAGGFLQPDDEGHLGSKLTLTLRSVESETSSSSSAPFSDSYRITITNSSQDSSFSSGISGGGSESSPNTVLIESLNHNDATHSINVGEKMDGGFFSTSLPSCTRPTSPIYSSDAESWLKCATRSEQIKRSRSSSNSLDSVPELIVVTSDDMKDLNECAPVLSSLQTQINDTNAEPQEQHDAITLCSNPPDFEKDEKNDQELALILYSQAEPESRKEDAREIEAGLLILDRFSRVLQWNHDIDFKGGEDGALVRSKSDFSPPQFARTCSELTYNLSEDGLQSLSKDVNSELPEVRRFTYEELRTAAGGFKPRNLVGTGGASSVYKAQLKDGSWVAVKRLVDNMAGGKEFMMEMMMLICTLNHPNLVTMIGFCAEGSHRLIAYSLLTRGSLESNLHNVTNSRKLNWEQRQKVAFGASRGLAYLHGFSPKPIIHRDIKTSNILLSDDFEAQISDFGLARWLSESDTTDDQVSCAGTFGYLAPECLMYGGFNERTDVFAFGVVLLELISGRRPMDEALPDSEQSLVLWARTLQQNGRTHHLVDPSLKDINPQQFKRMMYTAFLCVQVSPDDRPTMDRVVRLLSGDRDYSPAILQPNISAPPFMSMPELNGSSFQEFPPPQPSAQALQY